jgi:hypothetical protein
MAKLDSEDLLAAWQVLWGQLDPKWHPLFIGDPLVEQIIRYDSKFVYPSLKKFQKLSDVFRDIQESDGNSSVAAQVREDFLKHLEERDALLESRKKRERPKQVKPGPGEMSPLEPVEITMEDLRRQPGEKHWW